MYTPADAFREAFTARLDEFDADAGAWSWTEVYWDGVAEEYAEPDSPRKGTSNLFEPNGLTAGAGSYQRVWFRSYAGGQPTYEFSLGGGQQFARVTGGRYRDGTEFTVSAGGADPGDAGDAFDGSYPLGGSGGNWSGGSGGVTLALDVSGAPHWATLNVATGAGSAVYECAGFSTSGTFAFASGTGGPGEWPASASVAAGDESDLRPCGAYPAVLLAPEGRCGWADAAEILLAPLSSAQPHLVEGGVYPCWPKSGSSESGSSESGSSESGSSESGSSESGSSEEVPLYVAEGGVIVRRLLGVTVECVGSQILTTATYAKDLVRGVQP